MDFDFYTSFANKSNEELLQVILQKELYQPAAVEAAEKILASRNVSEDEMAMAKNAIEEKAMELQTRREKNEKLKSDAGRFIYEFIFPSKKSPVYVIRFFAIAFLVIWLIEFIPRIREFYYYWSDSLTLAFLPTAIEVATLLMIYWLFKLKKRGWVLMLIYFTVATLDTIYSLFFYKVPEFFPAMARDKSSDIFRLVISGLVFYFFNRKDILDALQVSKLFQQKTIVFGIIPITVLYLVITFGVIDLSYYLG